MADKFFLSYLTRLMYDVIKYPDIILFIIFQPPEQKYAKFKGVKTITIKKVGLKIITWKFKNKKRGKI